MLWEFMFSWLRDALWHHYTFAYTLISLFAKTQASRARSTAYLLWCWELRLILAVVLGLWALVFHANCLRNSLFHLVQLLLEIEVKFGYLVDLSYVMLGFLPLCLQLLVLRWVGSVVRLVSFLLRSVRIRLLSGRLDVELGRHFQDWARQFIVKILANRCLVSLTYRRLCFARVHLLSQAVDLAISLKRLN